MNSFRFDIILAIQDLDTYTPHRLLNITSLYKPDNFIIQYEY